MWNSNTSQEIDGDGCSWSHYCHSSVWNTCSSKETSSIQVNEELADGGLDVAALVVAVEDGGWAVDGERGVDELEPRDPGESVDGDEIGWQLIL